MTQSPQNALADVKQLGFAAAIASLGYVFWIVGGMEMVERLAYYGVKAVATLYAKDPVSKGGLGVSLQDFGTILMVWAFVQTFVPVLTGGLSDRYGYKETIFASTILKIVGYLIMAWFPSYYGFFAGAIVLATGTAIFKPGIQGTLVLSTNRQNSSVAWGIFYQTVNIGGFLGPLVAGLMRKWEWTYVFYACAAIICLNFLLLLTYREVGKAERLERRRLVREGKVQESSLLSESLTELAKPHVWVYLLIFSGFWFMFNALFDVLPAHIDDWVDTTPIVQSLFPSGKSENTVVNFFVVMNDAGTRIQPEGLMNLNSGIIMVTCFVFAYLSGLMKATTSMVIGTLLTVVSFLVFGATTAGWMVVGAIAIFSVGEMLSSPKFSEFIGNFAPADKKAMYLGFSQIPLAIGWTIEGKLGPMLYDIFASRDRFSRDLLRERLEAGQARLPDDATLSAWAQEVGREVSSFTSVPITDSAAFVGEKHIPVGEAFEWLVRMTGESESVLRQTLYDSHNVGVVWYIMAIVGVISALGIWAYGKWILSMARS